MGEASAVGLDVLESVVHESARALQSQTSRNQRAALLGEGLDRQGAGGDVDVALTQMKLQETCCPQ